MAQLAIVPAGHVLTVTAGAKSANAVQVEDSTINAVVQPGFSQTFGPYLVPSSFEVSDDATISAAAYRTAANANLTSNAGAPVDAVKSSVSINPAGDDNAIVYTARVAGSAGDAITVQYVDPGADAALSVSVASTAITVNLAYAESAITSTAAEVLAAIQADGEANSLVSVALDGTDSNPVDGSGVVTAIAKTALAGGAGTGIGTVPPGGLVVDTTNGEQYRNTGTLALPSYLRVDARGSEEHTATGAVTAGVSCVTLNHATVAAECTIADAANHPGFFAVVNTSASGTAAHKLTLTAGTFDGTNNEATLNAPAESLLVFFDGSGNGTIVINTGSVGLAAV